MRLPRSFMLAGTRYCYATCELSRSTERTVEVPIAIDFLRRHGASTPLEVGNVLNQYPWARVRSRRIVDKFEQAAGVDNIDLFDLPPTERYSTILSVSTVEHVGCRLDPSQSYGEDDGDVDRTGPLRAIRKLYELLAPGGRALVTAPAGRLLDGGWYIQFSPDYLELLPQQLAIPAADLTIRYLKRLRFEDDSLPMQKWAECPPDAIADVEYHYPRPYANGIVVIKLQRRAAVLAPPAAREELDEALRSLTFVTARKEPPKEARRCSSDC